MVREDYEGSISEWNEGNLKSLRLHEAQEMINIGKISPLKIANYYGVWNYEIWLSGLEILYGEGQAKYSEEEIKNIEQIKYLIQLKLKYFPIHRIICEDSIRGKNQKYILNNNSWEHLKKLIDIYERYVKLYNDKHGLSTRNVEDDSGL